MRLGHIELFVRDPLASQQFYTEVLGFEVVAVQDKQFVWLNLGSLEILLRPGQPLAAPATYGQAPSGLVLYTSHLAETVERLQRRGLALAPSDANDCFTFTDPDGHWFQLVDPEAPTHSA